jgi:putative cell wall-binding protein
MTPEQTLDWLAQQHFNQCRKNRPVQHWIRKMKSELPEQKPDYKEALRVLSLALEKAPQNLTPKQRSVWQQSKNVLLSGGGKA